MTAQKTKQKGQRWITFYSISRERMKVFFKDVVFTDIENYLSENPDNTWLPIADYAESKGFDVNLFRQFLNKLSNWSYAPSNEIDADNVSVNEIKSNLTAEELVWKTPWPRTRWNQNVVYFSLTDEDVETYSDFLEYYTNLWMFDLDQDPFKTMNNSSEVFNIYWNFQEKDIPEDYYSMWRYLNFPYLLEMHQWSNHHSEYEFLRIPSRYHTEWYYTWIWFDHQKEIARNIEQEPPQIIEKSMTKLIWGWEMAAPEAIWDYQSYTFWRLIPTSKETPYEDALPHMPYEYDPIHNHLPKNLQWASAIAPNLIWDAFANLTVNPLQWK